MPSVFVIPAGMLLRGDRLEILSVGFINDQLGNDKRRVSSCSVQTRPGLWGSAEQLSCGRSLTKLPV